MYALTDDELQAIKDHEYGKGFADGADQEREVLDLLEELKTEVSQVKNIDKNLLIKRLDEIINCHVAKGGAEI